MSKLFEQRNSGLYAPGSSAATADVRIEIRQADNEDTDQRNELIGTPLVFNSLSLPISGIFREVLTPWTKIDINDLRAVNQHDDSQILARETSENALTYSKDYQGLHVKFRLNDTSYANDLKINIQDKNIRAWSFGFYTLEDSWFWPDEEEEYGGYPIRTLLHIELVDVSPVIDPAYPATEDLMMLRNQAEQNKTIRNNTQSPQGRSIQVDRRRLEWRLNNG